MKAGVKDGDLEALLVVEAEVVEAPVVGEAAEVVAAGVPAAEEEAVRDVAVVESRRSNEAARIICLEENLPPAGSPCSRVSDNLLRLSE